MRPVLFVATLVLMAHVVEADQTSPQPVGQGLPITGAPGLTAPQTRKETEPGKAVIRGRVTRSDTGEPLRRVQVKLAAAEPHASLTDDNGRYEVSGLPAGRYELTAVKGGFAAMQFGQRRPFGVGRPVTLTDGQVLENVDFAMSPGAVIAGRIVDETGEPIVQSYINVSRLGYVNGRRERSGVGGGQTDDRGEFRIIGLPPGHYYVQADAPSGNLPGTSAGFVDTFYPGTPLQAEAQKITLKAGEEVAGITIALAIARTASVSGIVRDADGKSNTPAFLVLRSNSTGLVAPTEMTVTRPDGSFVLGNVPPGSYVLDARKMESPNATSETTEVTVNGGNVSGLVLTFSKAASARGRIRFDTGTPPDDVRPEQIRIVPISTGPQWSNDSLPDPPRNDWTFEISGLSGRRLLRAGTFRGSWTLKSIQVDGMDVTDTPIDFRGGDVNGIDVILTNQLTDVSGHVTDERGAKAAGAAVVAFADDPDRWGQHSRFLQRSTSDQDGRFKLRGLPAASYVVVAIDDIEQGEEFDRELLEQLRPKGTPMTLREGQTRTLDLKLSAY